MRIYSDINERVRDNRSIRDCHRENSLRKMHRVWPTSRVHACLHPYVCKIIFRMAPPSPPYLRAGPYWVTGRSSQRNVPIRAWYWSQLFRPRYKSSRRPGFLRPRRRWRKELPKGETVTAHWNASKEAGSVISVMTYRTALDSLRDATVSFF